MPTTRHPVNYHTKTWALDSRIFKCLTINCRIWVGCLRNGCKVRRRGNVYCEYYRFEMKVLISSGRSEPCWWRWLKQLSCSCVKSCILSFSLLSPWLESATLWGDQPANAFIIESQLPSQTCTEFWIAHTTAKRNKSTRGRHPINPCQPRS